MKYTLLQMTQMILGAMDSDEISSIADTTESARVAKIVEETYFYLVSELDLPPLETMFQLDEWADTTHPIVMTRPATTPRIQSIQYNVQLTGATNSDWKDIPYVTPDDFFSTADMLNADNTNITSNTFDELTLGDSIEIKYWNDRGPSYYTTLEDNFIIFDAIDTAVDTKMSAAKTRAFGYLETTVTQVDSTSFTMNEYQFSMFLNACKVQAFDEIKQTQNNTAISRFRKGKIRSQRTKRAIGGMTEFNRLPDYGRK